MKLKLAALSICTALIAVPTTHAAVTVDGVRNVAEVYNLLANQTTVSNWNNGSGVGAAKHEALANIHAIQDANTLAVHLAARVNARGIILFIDSKSGGQTFIPDNLISFGGEENYINNLGTNTTSGMTFETGFTPDYAVRIYGDGTTGAFVNIYDLTAGTRTEAGNAGVGVISKGFISQMRADSLGTAGNVDSTDYAAANKGVEMKLNLAALGVPSGAQTVKLMAVLVDIDSNYGSNQVLASRTSTTADIAEAINSINFQSEANIQTLPVSVIGPASRKITFNVNMTDEITKGNFNVTNDRVKVLFFSGSASPTPGEIFLTDTDTDQIYTGSLMVEGAEATAFGNYKFFNTKSGAPNSGFEYGADRTFNLGPLDVDQTLPVVVFRPNSFALWSAEFSDGQSGQQDKDGDGVKNALEYFMGSNNSQFTSNPQVVTVLGVRSITWPRDVYAVGVTFKVTTSENLSDWADVTGSVVQSGGTLKYTLPMLTPKLFVRLEVTVP
ncbi:MAG: hypothetical protein H8M99_07710 [Gloeobacteraceae cyanobacterium ES-bin-144]|nr:hypothetical protein [Verrucomicrobiales bacterium]